jgi:hypothetical protein
MLCKNVKKILKKVGVTFSKMDIFKMSNFQNLPRTFYQKIILNEDAVKPKKIIQMLLA